MAAGARQGSREARHSSPANPGPRSDPSAAASPSPDNERSRARREAFREAIEGLTLEDGELQVEPNGRNNADLARVHAEHGENLLALNARVAAIAAYTQAVRSQPELVGPYLGLGRAFTIKGETEYGRATFQKAVDLDPRNAEARFLLAMTLARLQQLDRAVAEMEEVLQLDPEQPAAHERLAIWSYYQGRYAKAWEHVHASEDLGQPVAPQFVVQLEKREPRPTRR